MAVQGRLVLMGLGAAVAYVALRARRQPASPAGQATGTGTGTGTGGADFVAPTTALDGASGADRSALPVPSATGAAPSAGASVEGAGGSPGAGTRADDPLTGVTADPSELPEASASPDGTPAAGPVETRRVGDDPA